MVGVNTMTTAMNPCESPMADTAVGRPGTGAVVGETDEAERRAIEQRLSRASTPAEIMGAGLL